MVVVEIRGEDVDEKVADCSPLYPLLVVECAEGESQQYNKNTNIIIVASTP